MMGNHVPVLKMSIKALPPFLIAAATLFARSIPVTITFFESVMVNDTVFTVGECARVESDDPALATAVRHTVAGQSAPPGYSRFLSSNDFVRLRLVNAFPEANFTVLGVSRQKIHTDYRPVTVGQFEKDIHLYLDSAIGWRPKEWTVDIQNTTDSVKCLNGPFTCTISGLQGRFPKGNDNLRLEIRQGAKVFRLTVRCRFTVSCPVLVAKREIARGAVLASDAVEVRTVDLTRFGPTPFTTHNDIAEMKAARTIREGTILHKRLVVSIPVIEKGEPVAIIFERGRIAVSVAGIARENGGTGDRIWVENSTSHKLVRVIVKAKGKVHALQGGVSI